MRRVFGRGGLDPDLATLARKDGRIEMKSDLSEIVKRIQFIAETDKLKAVLRKTSPIGLERLENSAEHCWQVALSALVLSDQSNEPIDVLKVVKMLLLHDIVEIDVGDTFHYNKSETENLFEKELTAAQRIFGMLDEPLRSDYISLWREFEERQTPESRYAAAVDRLMAFIMNSNNRGGNWPSNNITLEKILAKNAHIAEGSRSLWEVAQMIAESCREQGYISER